MAPNLRNLAKFKECQIRVPGICNFNPETTVLCHNRRGAVAGMKQKPPDLCGAWGCSDCHAVTGGAVKTDLYTKDELDLMFADGQNRTLALVSKELEL